MRVTLSAYEGRYKPWWRSVRLEVFGVEKPPKSLRAGERELREWQYDAQRKNVTLTLPQSSAGVTIQFVY